MRVSEIMKMSFKSILSNKLRSILTMLGIIIGVAAVMVIVGMGNGISEYMASSFSSMGTKTITVSINSFGSSRSISDEDVYKMAEDNDDIFDGCSPKITVRGSARIGTESLSSSMSGINESYLSLAGINVAYGRDFSYIDMYARKQVCIIGSYLASSYYGNNAVGDTLRISGNLYTIIGVLEQQTDSPEEGGTDDCIYLPYTTASRKTSARVSSYAFFAIDENSVEEGTDRLDDILYAKFGNDDSYNVSNMSEMLDTMLEMVNLVITILTVIAGISLLVGGIGIMNIMLVSVTERTKEIGIRKALGAKEGTILTQFVTEAAVLSGLGGIIGIVLGFFTSSVGGIVVSTILEEEFTISPTVGAMLIAFGISAGIGILFGYLPARKAAQLNPIDALRFE